MRRKKALSLVEVVVASFLLMVVFAASLMALDSNSKVLTTNRAHDAAISVAYKALDQAKLYGCGTLTGLEAPSERTSLLSDCSKIFTTPGTPGQPFTELEANASEISAAHLPDTETLNAPHSYFGVISATNGENARNYYVTLDYELDTSSNLLSDANFCTSGSDIPLVTPTLVRYRVDVYWKVRSSWKHESLTSTEALPVSYATYERGIVVHYANQGVHSTTFTYTNPLGNSSSVERTTTSDCIWFAFPAPENPVGSAQVKVGGQTFTQAQLEERSFVGNEGKRLIRLEG